MLAAKLRRDNRIRTIQASLAIENNSLSLEQVTAVLDGKRVLGQPRARAPSSGICSSCSCTVACIGSGLRRAGTGSWREIKVSGSLDSAGEVNLTLLLAWARDDDAPA